MDTTPRLIRVDPATVVIFSVLLSPALLVAGSLIWHGQQIPAALGLSMVYLGTVYGICSPVLELRPGQLTYHSLLGRRTIELSEVAEVKMSAKPAPTIHLVRKKRGSVSFAFIIKPFSKAGVVALLHHLRASCPDARFDDIANDLDTGDFRSITREAISAQNLIRIAVVAASATFVAAVMRGLLRH